MDAQSLPIVSYGKKYRGQPITTLLNDTDYLEWCKKQPDFEKKDPIVYNICVNQTITTNNQNSKTPEHNKLQNLFLKKVNREQLWNYITKNRTFNNHKHLKLNTSNVEFEGIFNWDCIADFNFDAQCLNSRSCCSNEFDSFHQYVFCEIKPLLGDDYPCVLRKMKIQIELTNNIIKNQNRFPSSFSGIYLLVIKQFDSNITTKKELIQIFKQANIKIVFIDELFDNLPGQPKEEQVEQLKITNQSSQQESLKLEEDNKLLRESLLRAEEKITQLEEEIISLKSQKQPKSIKDYFGKK